MQITYLPENFYKINTLALAQSQRDELRSRVDAVIRQWDDLRAEGISDAKCARFTGISRATYYRRKKLLALLLRGGTPPSRRPRRHNKPKWGEAEKQLVLRIRRENPTWGKFKIAVVIRRDHGLTISESTVGRILKHLKDGGLVQRSRAYIRKRKRNFNKHATRWYYKDPATMKLGERVQVDHMTVSKNGVTAKHFQAWERKSKHIHARVFSNAKATSARRFLREFVKAAPYKIISMQVDGGSEFRAEFEDECEALGIPLIVLPPKSPKHNGGVERGNRTFREDFYRDPAILADTIGALQYDLKKALGKYNTYRPHQALKGMTPMEYIENAPREAA